MITLSRYNRLETLWDEIKQSSRIPDEFKVETEQKLLKNRFEVRVNFHDNRIKEDDLNHQLAKYNRTIAMVEPLVNDVSGRLDKDMKLLVTDTNGVIISSQAKDVIGYCCPAAELVNNNTSMKNMVDMGCTLEVKYDNGIHSQLVPIFDEQGRLQFFWGISDHKPITTEASNLLYLAAQLFQQRYKYSLIVDEYTSSLMNAISDHAILIDENGHIINANDRCLSLMRLDERDILKGMPFNHLLSDLPSMQELWQLLAEPDLPSFHLQVWNQEIPCQFTYRQPILTPYGTHTVLVFSRLESSGWNQPLPALRSHADPFAVIIGSDTQLEKVKNQARQAARFNTTVLIEGESGTGKELLAEAIHIESRRSGPFIAINCGAIPPELIQSELFGYEEGAFTGARKKGNPGKLEMADGGTLFLDEIGEMPLDMQVNLLRFLQNKTITRVGGHRAQKVDVRIIAATNRHLKEEVEKGSFREDLYYRLNVIHLHMPSLRERRDDIPVLANHFVEKLSEGHGITTPDISASAMSTLMSYDWPGNVRELENMIERAIILCPGSELDFESLTANGYEAADGMNGIALNQARIEKEGIEYYLHLYQGNISRTAQALGITRQTLYRKIRNHDISREIHA